MAKTATFICGHRRVHEANLALAVDAFFDYSIYSSGRDPTRDPHATIYEKKFLEPRPGKQANCLLNIRPAFQNGATPLMDLMGSLYANKRDPVDATDPGTEYSLSLVLLRMTWASNLITTLLVLRFASR
jgi:hypothetical protein